MTSFKNIDVEIEAEGDIINKIKDEVDMSLREVNIAARMDEMTRFYPHSSRDCIRPYTVEPLIKATPEMRPPLYKGHFARSQMCILIQINP